ncbi:transposase, partial [Robertmurraya sp. DFI.2.37]|nr:transposase [Robertmurraya sp. DFI.2.37]
MLIAHFAIYLHSGKKEYLSDTPYRNSEKLTEDDRWYLERYLGFSNELRKAYHLKEWFSQWFKKA